MSYKITITEEREVTKMVQDAWTVVGEKEVARDDTFTRVDPKEPKTRMEKIYGHPQPVERTIVTEVKLLEQTVETLNLAQVIKAINGL